MTEWFAQNPWLGWTALTVLLLIVEGCTTSLVSIWFVPGAVLCAVLSLWIDSTVVLVVIFLAVSALVLWLSKRFFKRGKKDSLPSLDNMIVGKTAVAQTPITKTDGKVLVGDVYWRAVSDTPIEEGEPVTVTAVTGNTVVVTKE